MPRFDGTGPQRKGAFTGRGMGYCIKQIDTDNSNQEKTGKEVFDMPRGDGTGPMGMGPMTGRGAGYCAGYSAPGYANFSPGRGAGGGGGFYGGGRGRGRRNWYYATGLPGWRRAAMGMPAFGGGGDPASNQYGSEINPKQEASILKNQAEILKKQLEDIASRMEVLEKAQTEQGKDE